MAVHEDIVRLKADMRAEGIAPEKGLGQELFLFASTLMPVVNVDLLVFNARGEILMSWREDDHCGQGWHIPGGCLRLGESFSERLQKTALAELGTSVRCAPRAVGAYELFIRFRREKLADQRERSHFITLPFACRLPDGIEIQTSIGKPYPGDKRWFGSLPEEFMKVQSCYLTNWSEIYNTAWRDYNGIVEK